MKRETILSPLEQVRRRQRRQRILDGASKGLIVGALSALLMLVGVFFGHLPGGPLTGSIPFVLLACPIGLGTLLGALTCFFLPLDSSESARQTDRHYGLKDRLLTALKLLKRNEPTPMERLQLADAASHARNVDPRAVAPYRVPRSFSWGFALAVLVLLGGVVSPYFIGKTDVTAAERIPEVVSAVETLQVDLIEKIDELSEQNPEEKALKELSKKLQELVRQLDESSTEAKEALATLSEMEEAIRETMSEYQLEAVDASMQELADSLSAAEATRSASQALKEEKYDKAAEELDKLNSTLMDSMSKQERRTVSEQLRQTSQSMKNRGQKSLAPATGKLADAMEQSDGAQCKEGAEQLAGECRKQSLRKGICEGLQGKLSLLGLCKSECNGGNCQGANNGGENTNKSDRGSNNWGTGAAGNPTSGEETNLDGQREQKNITGMMGQGDSEYEKFNSSEAPEEKTQREFRENFQDYRKMSEAVLESEPIPLGQRQMIRRYFESIRPTESDPVDP